MNAGPWACGVAQFDDASATAARLDGLGAVWLAPLEARDDGWFAMLADPDDVLRS